MVVKERLQHVDNRSFGGLIKKPRAVSYKKALGYNVAKEEKNK